MITPPLSAPSFYTAIFEGDAAKFVVGLVAESFAKNDDIKQVMVTSQDFTNDISAIVELEESTREVVSHLVDADEIIDTVVKYNPLFLPHAESLHDVVETDEEGDIISVDGFSNPFSVMTMKHSVPEHPNVVEAKVVYKQFDLPPLINELEGNKEVLLS